MTDVGLQATPPETEREIAVRLGLDPAALPPGEARRALQDLDQKPTDRRTLEDTYSEAYCGNELRHKVHVWSEGFNVYRCAGTRMCVCCTPPQPYPHEAKDRRP